jgi:alpha-mannosidase
MAWRNTCFNQFHDIFDGSAIHGSYDYSRGLYDKSFAAGKKALNGAMSHIAAKVDTRGKGYPIVVFNPLAWVRTDAVEVGSPLDVEKSGTVSVTVTDGKSQYPAQITGDKLQFTAWNIPAMGYKVFWVTSAVPKRTTSVTGTADTIENEYFRIKVERATGAISSIYDKKNRREVVPAGSKADMLQILMEEPHGMSAWNLGQFKGTTDLSHAQDSEVLEAGPSRAMVRSEHHYGDSMFVQDVILHAGVPRIDIKMTADWKAKGTPDKDIPMLKVAFPAAVTKGKATFDIPFGSIERPANGDEVPAQKWIDLSGDNYGVSLLNDCKYGHDVKDNVMRLSLLRASYDPDPIPDIGVHEMTYSIFPHTGNWRDAGTPRRAYELNNPLFAVPTKSHSGAQPKEASFLSVEPTNVIVTALKRSEDGKALIVRFYETDGKPTNAVIKTSLPIKSVVETNLMERKVGKAGAGSRKIAVTMGKNEIKTLRLGL